MTNSIHEIAGADFILAIGTNTTESHPIISLQVRKALQEKGARLVVADPRKTEMAELADVHIQHRPGSDLALLNAMAHVIINEGLADTEFIAGRTEGFAEFAQGVAEYTPEYTEQVTGVPAETIRQVARAYATAERSAILYTMGITQHICGTDNVLAIANLAMAAGKVGRESTGVNPLRGQNNVQGACDMGGLPDVFPGYQKVTDPASREKFQQAWGVTLPPAPGLTVGEMMQAAHRGQVKGMYIIGENPVLSDPDANHVVEALENLDFLVVQDIFLSETARLADVVLPAASFAEKDGTFTNTERRVQRVRKAVEPPGQALPDWQVICRLSALMGYPMGYDHPADIMREIARVTPSYGGISYERLEAGGLQWPCPTPDHPGTPILHREKFSRGLGKFHGVHHIPPGEQPDAEYPLVLTTGRRLYHYHTGTMSRRAQGLEEICPEERLELNPRDAERFGIADGDHVRVLSRRGEIEITARITDRVQPGLVFASFHFWEAAVNKLTNAIYDPKAKIPELKVCAVQVKKVG